MIKRAVRKLAVVYYSNRKKYWANRVRYLRAKMKESQERIKAMKSYNKYDLLQMDAQKELFEELKKQKEIAEAKSREAGTKRAQFLSE